MKKKKWTCKKYKYPTSYWMILSPTRKNNFTIVGSYNQARALCKALNKTRVINE